MSTAGSLGPLASVPGLLAQIDLTFGAGLVGSWIAVLLFGILTAQTYFYFSKYGKESRPLNSIVIVLWLLNALHGAFTCHIIYYYLVTNLFNPIALIYEIWTLEVSIGLHVAQTMLVMGYFVHQIYCVAPVKARLPLCAIIIASVILHLAFSIKTIVGLVQTPLILNFFSITKSSFIPMLATQVVAECLISLSLCALLGSRKSMFAKTNTILNSIMIYAINRCILTSIVAMVELLAMAVNPHELWYCGAEFVVGGLFSNSLMASLNARDKWRNKFNGTGTTSSVMEPSATMSKGSTLANHSTGTYQGMTFSQAKGLKANLPSTEEIEISDMKSRSIV